MFIGVRRTPFRGDDSPLKKAIPPFCPRRQNGGAKNAAQGPFPPLGIPPFIGQRRGSHAMRANLNSVPTLSYTRLPASSAKQGRPRCSWSPKTAQVGQTEGKKRVEGRFLSVSSPKNDKVGSDPHGGIESLSGMQMLPQNPFTQKFLGVWGREKSYPIWEFATQSVQTQCATR